MTLRISKEYARSCQGIYKEKQHKEMLEKIEKK